VNLNDDSASILQLKNILDDQRLYANLVCISANFGIISKSITQLEKRGLYIIYYYIIPSRFNLHCKQNYI